MLDDEPPLLSAAAFFAAVDCFRFLVAIGASIEIESLLGRTVTQHAVLGGSVAIVRQLEQRRFPFRGCLEYACLYHRNFLLDWLPATSSPAHETAISNNAYAARFCLLKSLGLLKSDAGGFPPIDRAAYHGSLAVLHIFSLSPVVQDLGLALCHAAMAGRSECVNFLIQTGADPNSATADGLPLYRSVEQSHLACTRLLLDSAGSPETVLHLAARQYDPRVMGLCVGRFGWRGGVMLTAVRANSHEVLRFLLNTEMIELINEREVGVVRFVFSLASWTSQLSSSTSRVSPHWWKGRS
jgi:hypothetical protein